ncbi:YlxM family DNA-binding protein [Paenibacillus sp. CAU 1782]
MDALTRTTRINLLLDFYESLLTDKQRSMLIYYYHDDFSLGEIASELGVSRQAVYDNLKRAESALEHYESKLRLLARHERLQSFAEQLEADITSSSMESRDREKLLGIIGGFRRAEGVAGTKSAE